MQPLDYALFTSSDADEVTQLIARVFSASEPPAVAMGLTPADFEAFVGLLCPRAASDGLTIVARDHAGHIAGALLTDDFAVAPDIESLQISEKFLPILAMLDALDDQYRHSRSIAPGQYLHLFMLAVDADHAGRGIAKQLVTSCLANGRRRGYKHAVTEATGVVSQHVFRKLGFAERVSVFYQSYQYRGHRMFASIRGHESAILMDREI